MIASHEVEEPTLENHTLWGDNTENMTVARLLLDFLENISRKKEGLHFPIIAKISQITHFNAL